MSSAAYKERRNSRGLGGRVASKKRVRIFICKHATKNSKGCWLVTAYNDIYSLRKQTAWSLSHACKDGRILANMEAQELKSKLEKQLPELYAKEAVSAK